jgi:hypothetical protein
MRHSKFSLGQKRAKSYHIKDEPFLNKQGVFQVPTGKWIVRVRKENKHYATLSQHKTEEEAQSVYDKYQKEHSF